MDQTVNGRTHPLSGFKGISKERRGLLVLYCFSTGVPVDSIQSETDEYSTEYSASFKTLKQKILLFLLIYGLR